MNQLVFGALALDNPAQLVADLRHQVQQRLVRLRHAVRKELQHRGDFAAQQDGEGKGRVQPGPLRCASPGKVGVQSNVAYPGRRRGGQHPPGQPDPRAKLHGRRVLIELVEALATIAVHAVPDGGGQQARLHAGQIGQVSMAQLPAGVAAHLAHGEL